MTPRRTLTWVAVAALGVGLTTAMTITTTLLAQQPIGLSSESPSAGNALVPPVAEVPLAVVRHRAKPKQKPLSRSQQRRSPSVRPVVPATQVLAPPLVSIPTATVPLPTPTSAQPSSTRQGSGHDGGDGDRNSGEKDTSKDGGGGDD